MAVNIIRGEIGSGKSTLCVEMIKRVHEKYPDDRCIMLVPNHYSYETERRFVREFGGTGINNIEVMTLRKLANELLDTASLNYIIAAGRHMLIHKAISDFCAEADGSSDPLLLASMKKAGFTGVMSSLISEFKRYTADFAQLENISREIENEQLAMKLRAAANIYRRYADYIDASDYTDSEDDNIRLADRILKSSVFGSRTHVWVDSFDEISPQQKLVIDAMAAKGAPLTISVCGSDTKRIYDLAADTESIALGIAERHGMGEIIDTGAGFKGKKHDDIRFLLDNWGSSGAVYDREPENIELLSSRDIYSEIEKTACKITDLVREKGMRYRDIAILCGSTENYNHMIETVFDEYKIPYFTDSKIALSDHPIAMQLLSVFDIFENDWTYETMFRYIKSGFIYTRREINGKKRIVPINPPDIDRLENYVIKYGISGAARWTREEEWSAAEQTFSDMFSNRRSGGADEQTEEEEEEENPKRTGTNRIDELRRRIVKPLSALYEKTRGKKRAVELGTAVFEFLCDINLNAGLKKEIRSLRDEGHINEAEQFTKLWNLLLDVLNQAVAALGDEETDFEKFGEYIRVGLSQCEIRTIPSGLDQVYVGTVEKCSATEVKAMFIVGANDGAFPDRIASEGFFSDADRNLLNGCGVALAPDTKKTQERQYFKVYRAVCAVSEQLFISRPIQSPDGRALLQSQLISDVKRLMPHIKCSDDVIWDNERERMYISTPEATIHRMLINKSPRRRIMKGPLWDAVHDWYNSQPEWKRMIRMLKRADWYSRPDVRLDKELAEKLYENRIRYSASRLNQFSLCPFGYFMQYGIRAREREAWEVTPADVGSYAHAAIRILCETVEKGAETDAEKIECWKSLSDERREAIINTIIEAERDMILRQGGRDKEKNAGIIVRTGKNIKNAAKTVHRALSRGKYAQRGLEMEFETPLNDTLLLEGTIDRVDAYSDELETRVRIVDYKTGRTSFNIANIVNGVNMQMVIYAIAVADKLKQADKPVRVTGLYYNKVHDKMPSLQMGATAADAEAGKASDLKLDGVTFIRSPEDLYDMDSQMRDADTSDFLNAALVGNVRSRERTSVRSEEEMLGLTEFVKKKIEEIDERIKSGDISCEPYKPSDGTGACSYCAYVEVCRFRNAPEEKKCALNAESLWKTMAELGKKKGGGDNDMD